MAQVDAGKAGKAIAEYSGDDIPIELIQQALTEEMEKFSVYVDAPNFVEPAITDQVLMGTLLAFAERSKQLDEIVHTLLKKNNALERKVADMVFAFKNIADRLKMQRDVDERAKAFAASLKYLQVLASETENISGVSSEHVVEDSELASARKKFKMIKEEEEEASVISSSEDQAEEVTDAVALLLTILPEVAIQKKKLVAAWVVQRLLPSYDSASWIGSRDTFATTFGKNLKWAKSQFSQRFREEVENGGVGSDMHKTANLLTFTAYYDLFPDQRKIILLWALENINDLRGLATVPARFQRENENDNE